MGFLDDARRALALVRRQITEPEVLIREERERFLEKSHVLAGAVAHLNNNALMAILGNVDLLETKLPADSPVLAHLEPIRVAVEKIRQLSVQLNDYSGGGCFVLREIDLARMPDWGIYRFDDLALFVPIGDESFKLCADLEQIKRLVDHLIANAFEAIQDKRRTSMVTVRVGRAKFTQDQLALAVPGSTLIPGEYVFIEVSDTGAGMTNEVMAKAFDPFFTTKFIGRGMGLPVVLGIVRGHHGAIFVQSEPGKGSTFQVLFPTC